MTEPTPEPAQPDLEKTTKAQVGPDGESPTTSPIVVYVLLAAMTLFIFWPVVRFDFVNFDDPDYVGNWHVQNGLTLSGIIWAFGTWHPVTWISHMLDAQFFGKDPAGPHFVNLLLHVANSVLLFVVFRRLFQTAAISDRRPSVGFSLSPSDGGRVMGEGDVFWPSAF